MRPHATRFAASMLLLSLVFCLNVCRGETPERPASLQKAAELVDAALAKLETIPDYTYTLRKQERVSDELLEPQYLLNKIRHKPFSVYLRFTAPKSVAGKEALYVEGQNDGKLIGHGVGLQALFGTQKLDPKSSLAMMGNRNPITDSGMKNLLLKLQTTLRRPEAGRTFQFTWSDEEELVDKRPCFCVEMRNPKPSKDLMFARTKVAFDREWQLPVRFQRWYWSQPTGGKEQLVEDYTYHDVKFDCGLTDLDFDSDNPAYGF